MEVHGYLHNPSTLPLGAEPPVLAQYQGTYLFLYNIPELRYIS
jgi:hypothetical protein